jgi:hypothetical protein
LVQGTTYYYRAFATNAAGSNYSAQGSFSTEGISVVASLVDFGSVQVGSVSAEQQYIVSGIYLTGNLVITAPTGFQISLTSGSGFGTTLSLTPTPGEGNVNDTPIYVRFAPSTIGAFSGNIITHTSPSTTTINLPVSGTGIGTPDITTTGTLSDFGSVIVGNNSTAQNFTVSAVYLTANLIVTAPSTNFQVSLSSGSGFGPSVSLTPVAGNISTTTIYVRFSPQSSGAKSGNVTNASTGAVIRNVAAAGTGISSPVITTPTSTSITGSNAVLGGNITNINSSNVTERGIYWSTTNGFADGAGTKVSETGTFGAGVFTLGVNGLTHNTVYYYKAFATNGAGTSYTTQGNFTTLSPTILTSGSLSNFGSIIVGNMSAPQSYTVSATGMVSDMVITAPTGYQISLASGSGYGATLNLTPAGGVIGTTTIFVKFAPGTPGAFSANITHTGTGATLQNKAVNGTGIAVPVITTPTFTSITSTSAILGGDINNINFSNVTERGIYWSTTNGFADGAGTKVSATGSFGTGIFTINVSGLTQGVIYYYKAFATNAAGTSYTTQGTFATPAITVTGTLTNFGSVKIGNASTEQSYPLSATNLGANLVVTAPAGFEVSTTSGAGFGSTVTLIPVSGTAAATIYVKFAPGTVGLFSGNITNTSTGATLQNVAVNGTGINNPVIISPTVTNVTSTSAVLGGNITNINFSNVTERGIYYSTTNGFADGSGTKISETGTFGTGVFTVNATGLAQGTAYYFKAFAANAAGTSYTNQSSFSTQGITVTGALASFGSIKVGNNSTPQSFTAAGVNLTANLVLTAPTGYQVSLTSGSGYGASVTLTPAGGTVSNTTIYVRFSPFTTGLFSGNVTLTSTNAITQDVTVSGTGINNPVITTPTSSSVNSISAVLGGDITNINYSNVTERGIYYSTTNGFADGAGIKVSEAGTFGTGIFTVNVSGLSQAVTYYYKAFATNAAGTSYTTQGSFLTPAVFGPSDITVTQQNPVSGTVVIGTILTINVHDGLNGTPSAFQTVTCDLSRFGGPTNIPMIKTSDVLHNGIYTATYTVLPGNIEDSGRKVSVTVSNYTTIEDDLAFTVKNWLDIPDILTSYLEVNNNPLATTMKIGDTIHLKLTLKSYVDSVWVDWGSAFTGGPVLGYGVVGGQIDAAYTPVAGQLVYNTNLTINVVRMKSTNGFYTYSARMTPFIKPISLTAGGLPIIADLVAPDIAGAIDLFYDTNKPLRFSPVILATPNDGYTTLPNTFAIRFYIPEWNAVGGTSKITLKFQSESRNVFYRTFSGAEVTTIETAAPLSRDVTTYQQIIWDGKDDLGNDVVAAGVSTTYGITIWGYEDGVGNVANLTHILGPEFSPNGIHDEGTHFNIVAGITILNRIHVVVDKLNPVYSTNLTLNPPTPTQDDSHLIRYINDVNYNNAYDSGETVLYTDITSPTNPNGNNIVRTYYKVQREYTVDSNPLRHETVKGWVVLEETGSANKWYYNGTNWIVLNPADLSFQYNNVASVPFPAEATYSNTVNVSWDTSNLVTFPGSVAGITYKLYGYIQDISGNITKSLERTVVIENKYIQLPEITSIALTSQHVPGPGGILPAASGGINNYYLTTAYGPADAPYTGNYYVSPDIMNIEFTVNNPALLAVNNSVLVDFPTEIGIPDFYINKADFDPVTYKYTKSINVGTIPNSAGSLAGIVYTISRNAVTPTNAQVKVWSTLTIDGNNLEGNVNDSESLRLIVPAKPIFPSTDIAAYNLTANPSILSPGNPLFTYDAATNPANDNLKDESNFSFTIPATTTNITWTLKLETQDAIPVVYKLWTGNLTPAETPWTPPVPFNFNGLKDDFTLGVPITATQLLNLKLLIQPQAYADPGYVTPPASITPQTVVKVDNTNPSIISGANSTINPVSKTITLPAGTPIVTEYENQMLFTLYTSEPLPATISNVAGLGWQAVVRDSLGQVLMNGTNQVTATINNITPSDGNVTDGYQTFAFTVTIDNLPGDFTALKSALIIKSPWDAASNPGRYNNPVYPYNADVFHNDSNEAYLTFNIMNAKPRITQIDFTHRGVLGTASYVNGDWNPQVIQGWVNAGNPNTFTLTATVYNGMYRSLYSTVSADLSAFITGDTADTTAVVTQQFGPPNEGKIWTFTWTKTITAALANAWINNQVLNIPISIITRDGSHPVVHSETKDINIKVDKVNPTISSTVTSITANGAAQNLVFTIADPSGSGINWSTASLTFSPNTGITIGTGSNGTWPITIPTNSAIKYIDATCTVSDNMGNSFTYHRYINVIPVPAISGVTLSTINNGATSYTYFLPGRNLTVAFNLANPERVKRLVVTLASSGGVVLTASSGTTQTITSGITGAMSVVFTNVTSAVPTDLSDKIITATVTGVTDAYVAPTAATTQEINLTGNGSTANIAVDMVNPIISSTASSITANGAAQNLVFSISDPTPGSGINWSTASLSLSPNTGITIGTGSNGTWPVTIPTNTAIKYLVATVSVSDNVGNSTTYNRYLNIVPVPAISAVSLTTVNAGEVSNAYFVPGRNLTAAFTVTNPERVKRLVVTLTAPGVTILNNVQTITSGISSSMSVAFNGVTTAVPADLDGKVITATITGVTDAYIAPNAVATEEINLTGNGLNATINVDTKPVISSTTFYYNNVVTNTLLKNMTNVKIVAVVSSPNALNATTNQMTLTMQNVTGTFTLPTPVVTTVSGVTTYTWNNVSFTNLTWSPASDYKVAAFKFNCRTIYGYQAAERTHEMAVISDRSSQIYGVAQSTRTPYAGVDPDGWFAPEHTLKTDYTFISTVDQALPPIRANFDQIEDNILDNWTAPSNLSTKTPIVITVNQGGVPVTFTVYKYLARWSVQPDVQSVWNAYEDGAAAPIYFKYIQYSYIGEIDDTRSIQVDKKVPVYDKLQLWVAVKSTTPADGDYQFINNGFNRPTTLALQTNGSWVTGNNIYIKYRAKDSITGVGVTEIYTPANPTGWTATNVSQTDKGSGVVEKVVQLTPTNPASISASTLLALTLAKVEDKVGHVNYGLPVNSTDINWTQFGPVLNFTFSANYITNLRNLEAFQVIGGNYTDNKTKPYVRAGQPLGVTLKLAPLVARGVDVQSITVSNVKINTKWITSVGGTAADNFVTLTYRAADSLYYLNSSFPVNTAYTQGAGITLQYQINYTITYTDATTSSQQYNSGAIPDQAFVENNSPVLRDVFVWSNSLGQSQDGYVVPLDSDGTVKVIFEEQAGYANPNTKPSVQITNLNVFLAGMPSTYNVLPSEIIYYPNYSLTVHNIVKNYTNVWVADVIRPVIMPSPVVTSTEIGYTITDVVGNPSITGDRFVEIAANGPIVPIIRFAELVTTLPEGQIVSNYMAQTVPAQLKIYSDVSEIAYIEDAWATPISGITFGTYSVAATT